MAQKRSQPNPLAQASGRKPRGDSESVRVRQIENGFIVSRAGVKKGQFYETERFSSTRPRITVPAARAGKTT